MKKLHWFFSICFIMIAVGVQAAEPQGTTALREDPIVQIDIVVEPGPNITQQQGKVLVQLDVNNAPVTCRNFLNYVEDHFYDGTIFHRMIPEFMIQGGGYELGMKEKKSKDSIPNEASSKQTNLRGTIAMARTMEVDSATSQFFINYSDNHFLDHRDKTTQGYGYAVFGHVVAGMDWLESLQKMPTRQVGDYADVPARQILIKRVRVLTEAEKKSVMANINANNVDQKSASVANKDRVIEEPAG